MRGSITNQCLV